MFVRVPVKEWSTQRTPPPLSSSRSHKWEPMNPAPPDTSDLVITAPCPTHRHNRSVVATFDKLIRCQFER